MPGRVGGADHARELGAEGLGPAGPRVVRDVEAESHDRLNIRHLILRRQVILVRSRDAGAPAFPPLGLRLARTARTVSQAFERALADAGGSAAAWQVLLLVRSGRGGNQARMAEAMGITGATLTHHLNAVEAQGLVRRWREPDNRRVQRTALTPGR